jgi:uncharacterized protein YqjF (DUF2071 family)
MANNVVDPAMLTPFVPAKIELDFFNGKCFVSLVGFMFQDTRLKGLRIPLHENFEEINLRFYVRHKGDNGQSKRGVVFIKEIVPRVALSFVANTFYDEHYETLPTRHKWFKTKKGIVINYRCRKISWHKLQVVAEPNALPIATGSEEEFITEHYWGYTKLPNCRTSEYEVVHPRWDIYPVLHYSVNFDYGLLYGKTFQCLNSATPDSVLLAEGSEVIVRSGSKIRL